MAKGYNGPVVFFFGVLVLIALISNGQKVSDTVNSYVGTTFNPQTDYFLTHINDSAPSPLQDIPLQLTPANTTANQTIVTNNTATNTTNVTVPVNTTQQVSFYPAYPNKMINCKFTSGLNTWGWLSGMTSRGLQPIVLSESNFSYMRLTGDNNLSQWIEVWSGFGKGWPTNVADAHPGDTIIVAAKIRTSAGRTITSWPYHKGAFIVTDIRPLTDDGSIWPNETSNRRLTQVMEVAGPSFITNGKWVTFQYSFTIPSMVCDSLNPTFIISDNSTVVELWRSGNSCSKRIASDIGAPMWNNLDVVFDWSIWAYDSVDTADITDCYLAIVPKSP